MKVCLMIKKVAILAITILFSSFIRADWLNFLENKTKTATLAIKNKIYSQADKDVALQKALIKLDCAEIEFWLKNGAKFMVDYFDNDGSICLMFGVAESSIEIETYLYLDTKCHYPLYALEYTASKIPDIEILLKKYGITKVYFNKKRDIEFDSGTPIAQPFSNWDDFFTSMLNEASEKRRKLNPIINKDT